MRVLFCALVISAGCDATQRGGIDHDLGVGGGGTHDLGGGGGGGGNPDGGSGGMSCMPDLPDLVGCSCAAGDMHACWSGDPSKRNVGACKDGTQTCSSAGEFATYGACMGAVLPASENCTNGVDDDCNGKTDCADPGCATNAACNTGCTDGQTRPCYDGPSGTENVGTCKDGTQTCAGGMWPANCPGETLPTSENCTDPLDHNCNHLPGCLDLFACISNPACQNSCSSSNVDPMCVCPMGSGDAATCPQGMHGVTKGGSLTTPGITECCPCTGSDCGDPTCCAESVCAGNSQCGGLTCNTLPASCNGQVNADCDDFPEDCDEPCCPCSMCP